MLYYIGYHNCSAIEDEERITAPAAVNKMNYIISALVEATGKELEVVSPAETRAHRIIKGKKQKIQNGVMLKTFLSFSSRHKMFRALGHLCTRASLLCYLYKNVQGDDHIIVYHSLALIGVVKFLKKRKKCKLTIEVEELYSDVTENAKLKQKEIKYLQIADNFIFITNLLRKEVNAEKTSIISHGTYRSIPDYKHCFDDDKIHVAYAGTFRQVKGGALTAISAAEFLDENYVLEVLGNGSDTDIQAVKDRIGEVSQRTKCKINYVGFKSGDEFNSYMQACHIGLSTQQAEAKFNATSFPSKILMYMSNGMRVVSVRIPAVETSAVGGYVYYYDNQDAKEIATVIKSVVFNDQYNSRYLLDDLHKDFLQQLRLLLHG